MRDHYDFSDSTPNPYAKRMGRQIATDWQEHLCAAGTPPDLWCQSASRRLISARKLADPQLGVIQEALFQGCPEPVWPYGNATSINPLLVTLGVSQGDSPQAGDDTPAPLELPPAGRPHSHVNYPDPRRYWDKVRHLACAMATPPGGSETDAYALFGNMNLDPERNGNASSVVINPAFAEWVLRTIRWGLRPRWLVCLGLKGKLRGGSARQVFESIFELNVSKPDEEYQLIADPAERKCYRFREWEVRTGGDPLTVVFWPNHPSRHPFTDFSRWCDACEQFKDRHAGQIAGGA